MNEPAGDTGEFRTGLRQVVGALDMVYGPTSYLMIGAFARDAHVHLRAGLPLPRATSDVDIGIAVRDTVSFDRELKRLQQRGTLRTRRELPRESGLDLPVDVLPFGDIGIGGVVTVDEVQYDVRGIEDAFREAELVDLGSEVHVRIPSLSALIGLKLIAWAMRRKSTDAKDLASLLDVTAEEPYSEFIWSADEGAGRYDFELALEGPYLYGRLLAATFRDPALARVIEVLDPDGGLRDLLDLITPSRRVRTPSRSEQLEAFRQGVLREVPGE